MPPETLPELLSAENRREAQDLGLKLASEEAGGAVVFGCGLSGRYEIAQHAARELPRDNKHWVPLDVAAAPRVPGEFLRALAFRLFKRLMPVAPQGATDLLRDISAEEDLFLRQELVRDALRGLSPGDRPTLFFRNLDAVETTHQSLDSIFEALRDILLETGIYCFVTSTKDIRKSSAGVSHFANNFTTLRPHPVKLEEVEAAWGRDRWLPPDIAARVMVKEYGFAERRVHKAMQVLSRLKDDAPGWAERLKASARSDFPREAEKFYKQLDQSSQQVLKNSVRGHESAPEHVQLILRHDWARYMLRAVSDESVEIYDSPLLGYVEEELLKESASRARESSTRPFEPAVQQLRDGDPSVAVNLLENLAVAPGLSERQHQVRKQLWVVARALDRVIHADYPQAHSYLEGLGSALNSEAQELLALWKKTEATRDMAAFYERGPRGDLLTRMALDLARAQRREWLQRWIDAFKDYMVIVEFAAQAVLAQRGWTRKQSVPRTEWPADALPQYQSDRKQCGEESPPIEIPTRFHGGLEALCICRALNLANLRKLRMKELNVLFDFRTKLNHYPGYLTPETVSRAHELASEVLVLTADSWGLSRPDGHRLLWPESLISTLLES